MSSAAEVRGSPGEPGDLLTRPIFIIGAPRSGTSMLFALLNVAPRVFSMRAEGRFIWGLPEMRRFHPVRRGWRSGELTAEDATPEVALALARIYYRAAVPSPGALRESDYRSPGMDDAAFGEAFKAYIKERVRPLTLAGFDREASGVGATPLRVDESHPMERALAAIKEAHRPLRFVEKTPANCLRVGFLDACFPDAFFIYLKRDGRGNVNSLIEGWKADLIGYHVPLSLRIPGVTHQKWRYILPPGWQDYVDRPLEEVATFQWLESNRVAMEHLATVDPARTYTLSYEDLVDHTPEQVRALCRFIGVAFEGPIRKRSANPPVRNAHTPPEKDKWKRQNGPAIERMLPVMAPMLRQMGYDEL